MERAIARVLERLTSVFGADGADAVLAEALRRLGLVAIGSPDELFRVGEVLGGWVASIGTSVKADALLLGATSPHPPAEKLTDMSWMNGGLISLRRQASGDGVTGPTVTDEPQR